MFFVNSCKEKGSTASTKSTTEETQPLLKDSLKLISNLSSSLNETSGLIFYNNKLFTHNDKGSPNQIFVIDTATGLIKNLIILTDASSVDYEDIAQSSDHIFVGDIGNKFGDRTNLCIYKIKKSDLNYSTDTMHIKTNKISFSYPDQKSFNKNKDHNFDCEAMIYFNDSLYLFTKNRLDKKCNLYVVANKTGSNEARFISNFDTKGLITGADISKDGSRVVLTGYNKKGNSFLWVLSNFKNTNFFSGNAQQIILGPYSSVGQTEAVCFSNIHKLFISAEKTSDSTAKLYSMKL